MKNASLSIWILVAAAVSISPICSNAESMRNTDHITIEAGAFTYGDEVIDEIFGPHLDIYGSLNKVLNQNVALLGEIEGIFAEGSIDGVDVTHVGIKGGLSLVYLVTPENSVINPYILAGALAHYHRIEASDGGDSASDDDSDVGFKVGGGVEFNLGPKSFGDVGLIYQSIGDFDSIAPNARFGYSLGENTVALLTVGYAIDEEDYWVRLGLGVKL